MSQVYLNSAVILLHVGKKGDRVWTGSNDAEALSQGVYNTYTTRNLRYSQVSDVFLCSCGLLCLCITELKSSNVRLIFLTAIIRLNSHALYK